MNLSQLEPAKGSRRNNVRKGRGSGSGQGKTAGKGHKGQKARSGKKISPSFEGGQVPLMRRLPKFGFTNRSRIESAIVNLRDLEQFKAGSVVDRAALRAIGLISNKFEGPIKILGQGELSKALTVKVTAFSAKAAELIKKAGGTPEVLK